MDERVIKIYPGDSEYDFYCSDIRELYGFRTEENICENNLSLWIKSRNS